MNPDLVSDMSSHAATAAPLVDTVTSAVGARESARPASVAPAERPKLTQADLIEGGSSKEVKINPKTMAELLDRMKVKAKHAKSIQDRQGKLSPTDTYLLDAGVIQRLESGQLTREDYIIALLDINDELSQKAFALGKTVRDVRVSLIERLGGKSSTILEDLPGTPVKDSSYIQEIRYTASEAELKRLNQLRMQLNESLFGRGFKDPLFDGINTSIFPGSLLAESRHDVYSEIGRQIENVIADRIKARTLNPGETPQNLWATNKREMALVIREANHRALEQMTLDRATAILSSPPEISKAAITARAAKLRNPPTREELTELLDVKTKADAETAEAQAKYDALKAEYDDLTAKSRRKTLTKKLVDNFRASNGDITTGHMKNLQDRIANNNAITEGLADPAAKQAQQALGDMDQREFTRLATELKRLLDEEATADIAYQTSEETRLNAIGTPTQGKTVATGEFKDLERNLKRTKATAKTATETHEERAKALDSGASPESKQKADDLEEWNKVYDGYGNVLNTQRKQKAGDPYTLDRLSNTARTTDGQLDGAERIRGAIFMVSDPSGSSPEQARRMINDEAIARGIIHTYGIDINFTKGIGGLFLADIMTDLKDAQDELEALKATPSSSRSATYDKDLLDATEKARDNEVTFLESTLPLISPTNRAAGIRLLSFLITEGARSAQKGNPYLEIDRHLLH